MVQSSFFVNQFPYEIQLAIKGLNNKNRQKILTILRKHEKISFSEISRETSIGRSLLASHLNTLIDCLMVDHFFEHEIGVESYSFYKITSFGRRIVEHLLNALYVVKKETMTITLTIKHEKEATSITGDKLYDIKETKYESEDAASEATTIMNQYIGKER